MLSSIRAEPGLIRAEGTHAIIPDELNGLFEAERLAARIILKDGNIKTQKINNKYRIDHISDAERTVNLLSVYLLFSPPNGRIFIDLTEHHLNF